MDFEEINEPVKEFDNRYREEHKQNTFHTFEEFVKTSNVDRELNRTKVAEIKELQEILEKISNRHAWYKRGRIALIVAFIAIVGVCYIYLSRLLTGFEGSDTAKYSIIAGIVVGGGGLIFGFVKGLLVLNKKINNLDAEIAERQAVINAKINEAWEQMQPLNALFEWDTVGKVVMKTLPIFTLDKYFSNARLGELAEHFGLVGGSHEDNSMLCCQSGAINGNPFVMCESKNFEMGTKEYEGSLRISWKEEESYTDSDGRTKYRTVSKSETLYATIERPFPTYDIEKFLIYGNEAAPDLSFSRTPASFSGGKGMFSSWKLKRAMKKQENKGRKEGTFTTVGNKEFDATFGANDRDNEQQFRLMYTALGQKETLKILNDTEVGFGDDFMFRKSHMINVVQPQHLMDIDISCSPNRFYNYDIEQVEKTFTEYSNNFFKHFFFAFAPVLAVPIYQQHRSDLDIYKDVYGKRLAYWDCETIANAHGEDKFAHPDCVTDNILKVQMNETSNGTKVDVTAKGFKGVKRTDYVSKYGGDGRYHDVPVKWIEYIPVEQTSMMVIKEAIDSDKQTYFNNLHDSEEWKDFYSSWGKNYENADFRNSVISFIPNK